MSHERIIEKIKKCLELSSSDNEHEAALALRTAHRLMREYNITHDQVDDSRIVERAIPWKGGAPKDYEADLISMLADVFGAVILYSWRPKKQLIVVALEQHADLIVYLFELLLEKLQRARKSIMSTFPDRWPKSMKTKYADSYCVGWSAGVRTKVDTMIPKSEWESSERAKRKAESQGASLAEEDAYEPRKTTISGLSDLGHLDGMKESIFRPVGDNDKLKIES